MDTNITDTRRSAAGSPQPLTRAEAVAIYGSQNKLALALGISRQMVCKWGDGPIPERYALRIRYVLKPEAFESPKRKVKK